MWALSHRLRNPQGPRRDEVPLIVALVQPLEEDVKDDDISDDSKDHHYGCQDGVWEPLLNNIAAE